jgi:hypothetical protein
MIGRLFVLLLNAIARPSMDFFCWLPLGNSFRFVKNATGVG